MTDRPLIRGASHVRGRCRVPLQPPVPPVGHPVKMFGRGQVGLVDVRPADFAIPASLFAVELKQPGVAPFRRHRFARLRPWEVRGVQVPGFLGEESKTLMVPFGVQVSFRGELLTGQAVGSIAPHGEPFTIGHGEQGKGQGWGTEREESPRGSRPYVPPGLEPCSS